MRSMSKIARSGPDRAGGPADGPSAGCDFGALDDDRHASHLHRQTTGQHGGLDAGNRGDAAAQFLVDAFASPSAE